ncbi:MAG: IS630 family transposase [Candidatus Staskawiczbacteria bacterium]|nr:IS630 family transposase [Candidatus Staskawiczbacteria bacterium]
MKKLDGRKLSHEALEEIRIRAVTQVQRGKNPEEVIAALGMTRYCIYNWLAAYRSGGWHALKSKKLNGRPKKLTGKQMQWIYKAIIQKNPQQYRFEFALWTLKLVKEMIHLKLGVKLSIASVWRLLKQLGLTCQRPLFKAYQQDVKAVKNWLRTTYPKIKMLAKCVKAEIFFGDEAGVRSDFHAGTTWAPKGETPVVESNGQRFGLNIISAVSPRGEMRFMVVEGTVKTKKFITFLSRLIIGVKNKVFLIVDGHPTHRSKKVKECVASTEGKLGIFYLPGYSPELNPDEFVWNDLKNQVVGRKFISTKDDLKSIVMRGMCSLQKNHVKIKSYFQARHTQYAA